VLDVGDDRLFAFKRTKDADQVTVVVNVTASECKFRLGGSERTPAPYAWLIEVA